MSFKTKIGMARVLTRRIGRCAEETQSVSKGRFGSAEPEWCASIRAALAAAAICMEKAELRSDGAYTIGS